MTTYRAIDRGGRTVATFAADNVLDARAGLDALITEADAPEGRYLSEDWVTSRLPDIGEHLFIDDVDEAEAEPEITP